MRVISIEGGDEHCAPVMLPRHTWAHALAGFAHFTASFVDGHRVWSASVDWVSKSARCGGYAVG